MMAVIDRMSRVQAPGQAVGVDGRTEPRRPTRTNAVVHAVAILKLLANAEQPMGVNSIARTLVIAPSSCFAILKTLVATDFVEIDNRTKGYSLGSGAIGIARRALDPSRAFEVVRSRLEQVAQSHSIAIGFWRMLPGSRMVLAGFVEGANQMRIHMSVGQRLPVFVGAVGRAVAARSELSSRDLQEAFATLRWQTPLSFDEYRAQVDRAKIAGYAVDDGNFARGVTTVAVAIADETGIVRHGLSAIMFNGQHDAARTDIIAEELVRLADWCSTRLHRQAT